MKSNPRMPRFFCWMFRWFIAVPDRDDFFSSMGEVYQDYVDNYGRRTANRWY